MSPRNPGETGHRARQGNPLGRKKNTMKYYVKMKTTKEQDFYGYTNGYRSGPFEDIREAERAAVAVLGQPGVLEATIETEDDDTNA